LFLPEMPEGAARLEEEDLNGEVRKTERQDGGVKPPLQC